MSKNKKIAIPRETVEKYIEAYYKAKCQIDETIQPNFWEAVILLCNDVDTDVSKLIDNSTLAQYCIKEFGTKRATVEKVDKQANDVNELAKNIANSIRKSESTDVSKLEVFLMKKRIESMEYQIKSLSSRL